MKRGRSVLRQQHATVTLPRWISSHRLVSRGRTIAQRLAVAQRALGVCRCLNLAVMASQRGPSVKASKGVAIQGLIHEVAGGYLLICNYRMDTHMPTSKNFSFAQPQQRQCLLKRGTDAEARPSLGASAVTRFPLFNHTECTCGMAAWCHVERCSGRPQ